MGMECESAKRRIEEKADGRLPPGAEGELTAHLSACARCAEEERIASAVGPMVRAYAQARTAQASPRLDAMWGRVRAGIAEGRQAPVRRSFAAKWLWIPAVLALAVFTLLFYPTGTERAPFRPRSFDVAFEDVESDAGTVALVNKGEELPRVIWIVENGKS
jgi:anti-sigma factor RsiW